MDQGTFNLITVVVSIGTLIITLVGLYAVYIQIKKLRQAAWSDTHSKLSDQSFELLRFLAQNPGTYDYFYNRKKLEDDAEDKVFILYATEALVNFLEHLVLQKENLPKRQWHVWKRFIYSTFESSELVCSFIQKYRSWYSAELLAIADEFERRHNINQVS